MPGYSASFARIYNLRWARFAQTVAPELRAFYEATPVGAHNRALLDVCCGTGQLALHFLDSGYSVTGLDLSVPMLEYARANAAPYIVTGQARFIEADAANFTVADQYGLAVSTFDALNHLPDFASLRGCFESVYAALVPGGLFIFDLNTPAALRNWNNFSLEDTPELMQVTRAIYDEAQGKAYTRISGFVQREDGLYDRFEEYAVETAFDLEEARRALLDCGFTSARIARLADLNQPLEDPDRETRVYFVARKPEEAASSA